MSNNSKTLPKETPEEKKKRISLLEAFFDIDNKNIQNKYNKNNTQNDKNSLEKNQQEFGHKKRIKP
jgi:hypothetical protein